MTESEFNTILGKSLRNLGWHAQKIPDSPFHAKEERFTPKRPYDIFAFSDDYSFAIESKLLKPTTKKTKYCAFNFNKIEHHQLNCLIDANSKKRTVGILALYVWRKNEVKEVNLIPVDVVYAAMDDCDYGFTKEFLADYKLKFNCYNDLFALPMDLDKQLFKLKQA